MPGTETLYDYYLRQHQLIERCFKGCADSADKEVVHEMRLGIKKLRAFAILVRCLQPERRDSDIIFTKNFKRIFKLSGRLRDTQVQIRLIEEFGKEQDIEYFEFRGWLVKREKKYLDRLCKNIPDYSKHPVRQEVAQIFSGNSDESFQKGAGEALGKLYKKALNLSGVPIPEKKLHKVRTVTKQMRYIFTMVQNSYPDFGFEKITIETLREIEATAGHWHDCLVRVELIYKFLGKLDNTDEVIVEKYKSLPEMFKNELDLAYNKACKVIHLEFGGKQ